MTADVLQAGNTAEPMASGVYEFKECRGRMLLDVRRTNCKLIGTLRLRRQRQRRRRFKNECIFLVGILRMIGCD